MFMSLPFTLWGKKLSDFNQSYINNKIIGKGGKERKRESFKLCIFMEILAKKGLKGKPIDLFLDIYFYLSVYRYASP